jgi:hypothetical protein
MLLEMTMYDIDDQPTIAELLAMPWLPVKHWFPRNIREEEVLKRGVR